MKRRNAAALILIALAAVPLLYVAVGAGRPILAWLGFGVASEIGNWEDFRFSGVVVGESGEALEGVILECRKSRKKEMGFATDYESTYVKVNGRFDVDVHNGDAVVLQFTRSGYELEKREFLTGGDYANIRIRMRRRGMPPATSQVAN